jgi:hypothetical protein
MKTIAIIAAALILTGCAQTVPRCLDTYDTDEASERMTERDPDAVVMGRQADGICLLSEGEGLMPVWLRPRGQNA